MASPSPSRKRPLSPHLHIYKPQLTSGLSILHRLTGVALCAGFPLVLWWLGAAAHGPDAYATASAFFGSWFGTLILFGWTLALFFHLCNGIRHLAWDWGLGFEMEAATRSAYAVLAATAALTVLAWVVGAAT